MIRIASRLWHRKPGTQTAGHHCNHRIARPRDIEHFTRTGTEMLCWLIALNERHTGFTARDQHGVNIERLPERAGLLDQRLFCFAPPYHRLEFRQIRSDQCRAPVALKIGALGVDECWLAQRLAMREQRLNQLQRPFGVVAKNHQISVRQMLLGVANKQVVGVGRQRLLEVHPQ